MKRTLIACVTVAFGAGVVLAASPEVDKAIKTIQSAGADSARMKLFCELDEAAAAATDEKEDPALEKQVDDLLTQLGADFEGAWDAGDQLDEKSADAKEYDAAVSALAEKCQ